jgi:O-antigen/teichoic acid export membrane protein
MAYSLPMIPNALFWWIGTSINRFFITGMIGIAASGLFAAAGKIPNLLNLFSQIFQQAWNLSAFQEFRSENVDKFFNTMYKAYTAFMSIGTALIILMTPFLAGIMLQKAFFKAWTLIPLLLLALFFNTLNAFFGSVFTAGMHTKYLFTSTAAGAICCIILNALLIPMYGLIGASIAMIASNALVWLLRIRTSRLFIQIRIGWPLLLATIAMLFLEAWTVSYVEGSVKWIAGVLLVVAIFGIQGLSVLPLACEYRQGRKLRNSTNN